MRYVARYLLVIKVAELTDGWVSFQIPQDKQDETGGEDHISYDLSEFKQSARAIYTSAGTTVGLWSTTGSEIGVPLPTFQKQELESWVEEVSLNDTGEGDSLRRIQDFSSAERTTSATRSGSDNSTASFTQPSLIEELVLPGRIRFSSQLLEKGKLYYAQAFYKQSYNCFDGACQAAVGNSNQMDGSPKAMSEIFLALYLSLSALRVLRQTPKSKTWALFKSAQVWESIPTPFLNLRTNRAITSDEC
jgi:hypothetical protein